MARAVIRDGRWVKEEGETLTPVDLHQLHTQLNRIHTFAEGVCELTHSKIEILTHILDLTPSQERAVLNIMKLSDKEINEII